MKCALCDGQARGDLRTVGGEIYATSKLCGTCDGARLSAASAARILAGTGLTYSNAEAYSEENWIAMNTPSSP